ncbi:MAG: hypothetical protein ABW321_20710 [Polyangiales bacterium]
MDEPNKPVLRLVPARPPSSEQPTGSYLPRLPWRYLLIAGGILLAVVLAYTWRQEHKAAELRAHLTHITGTELKEASAQAMAFRTEIERLTLAAAKQDTQTSVAPDFQLQDLRSGRGSYLRIPLAAASDVHAIADAAKVMEPDWIPSCLGLNPTTTRELYEVGEFLAPSFVRDLSSKSVMQLRVMEDTVQRRRQTDLTNLLAATHSDWFMLVLQEGESRRDDPVRVFLWDLKRDTLLVRARVRSQGILLTTRIESQGITPSRTKPSDENGAPAANDCSIANALKKLTTPRVD